jgi:hypothetical protein
MALSCMRASTLACTPATSTSPPAARITTSTSSMAADTWRTIDRTCSTTTSISITVTVGNSRMNRLRKRLSEASRWKLVMKVAG